MQTRLPVAALPDWLPHEIRDCDLVARVLLTRAQAAWTWQAGEAMSLGGAIAPALDEEASA
jgi:hypothetical protein